MDPERTSLAQGVNSVPVSTLEDDPIDPHVIRKAFVAAAKEAEMYLSPESGGIMALHSFHPPVRPTSVAYGSDDVEVATADS